ncbi:MAG: lipoate--protein ligase [Bacillota bacterium]
MKTKNLTAKFAAGDGYNPWYNLALEEYLLDNLAENEIILYLWQNDNTVVIGRNQNAWQECRVGDLEANGGKLARRLSGGGAVFHDKGNLNYTLLMPRMKYDLKENLKVILKALQDLGVDAEFSGRNDIICDGKKISGNAYYLGTKAAYIHGTVLIDSDLEKLVSYLKVSDAKIKSKGIDSVKARVMNLSQADDRLSVAKIKDSIKTNFAEIYNQGQPLEEIKINDSENEEFKKLYDKYSSWDWRFGKSPDFDISLNNRFDWGELELNLKLSSGTVAKAVLYSDAMYSDLIPKISEALTAQPFELEKILKAAKKSLTDYNWQDEKEGKKIKEEFLNWLENELKTIIY